MSWLFDRLCEIAVADQVEVVVAADICDAPVAHDAADLADVLSRAAAVPQLAITLMHHGASPQAGIGAELHSVDLDELAPDSAACATAAALRRHRHDLDTALRVRGNVVSLVETTLGAAGTIDGATRGTLGPLGEHCRSVVATDAAGRTEQMRVAAQHGLGIAIGGVDPEAQVRVDTFSGVVSILDALVTLRTFAFGGDREKVRVSAGSTGTRPIDRVPPPALRRVV